MNSNRLGIGILGAADIALRALLPAIRNSRNAQIVAIASRETERAHQVAAAHEIPRAYGSYDALLQDETVQAVYIPLPNALHAEWIVRAAEHGKHVLCEKPLVMTVAQMDVVERAAQTAGVVVMEALMYRLHPQTVRVQELVVSGALGPVQLVTSAFTYHVPNPNDIRLSDALGGGVLLDVGTYCVSVSRLAAQTEPLAVVGSARIGPASDVDEVFAGLLSFPGGAHATFACALHGPRDQWYRITGTEATLTVPVPFAPGAQERELIIRRGWQRGKETEERIPAPGTDQYQLLVEHFADCVFGHAEPQITLQETRANVAVLEALRRSAHEKKLISM